MKRRKKKKPILILCATVLLISGAAYAVHAKAAAEASQAGLESSLQIASHTLGPNEYQLSGKIKSIYGNEITLELGALGENADSMPAAPAGDASPQNAAPPSGESGEPPQMRMQAAPMGEAGSSGTSAPSGERAAKGSGERASGQQRGTRQSSQSAFTKSGETKTYLIPVKTPVYASIGASALSFSQLETGKIVTVTLYKNDNGDDTIVSIQVVS